MKYTGPIYRPPYEGGSLLLQVTVGCAHNKCAFCTMYRGTQFSTESIEQVEKDLKEARKIHKSIKRVFLVNGDAFVLGASRLKPIAEKIIEYFPEVEVITMYAHINNIKGKTDEELKELAKLRINDLWVGVETGHEEALKYLDKGFNLEEAKEQLKRLGDAGIRFIYGMMYGAAGRSKGIENALANAKLINETKPMGMAPTTLNPNPGTKLWDDVEDGKFTLATEGEIFEEMKSLLKDIEVEGLQYLGRHAINTIPFDAILPRDKKKAIEVINATIDKVGEDYLNSVPKRHSI
ncbi:radical SAM protein [uncultured Ilyobacter sp.]|uniref:radical SAM protein n=1 Tax=uncultured Ilyobacter sp. TaxID=544433 RepID=UPI0029C0F603|nr:radical SAM protein [uncultured Ilyobacter sp.]